jgi:hypothetical protein
MKIESHDEFDGKTRIATNGNGCSDVKAAGRSNNLLPVNDRATPTSPLSSARCCRPVSTTLDPSTMFPPSAGARDILDGCCQCCCFTCVSLGCHLLHAMDMAVSASSITLQPRLHSAAAPPPAAGQEWEGGEGAISLPGSKQQWMSCDSHGPPMKWVMLRRDTMS